LIKYIILFLFVFIGRAMWANGSGRESLTTRDSSYVLRTLDADFLEKYRNDPAFDYTRKIQDAPEIWERIKRWVLERLFKMNPSESSLRVLDIILYVLATLVAVGLVYVMIRNRNKFLFRKRENVLSPDDSVEYTGEQEADTFVRLLAKAEQDHDYVLAIRVSYSGLLQMLDKKQIIRWESSKTNRNYIYEIKNKAWSRTFEEISRIFDHVCYGEFPVNEVEYRNIKRYFIDFRKEVES